eukprot:m.35029 g.35029  ORF g.35029 m.35029 type:complete len:200 (+) comp12735_c0_seq1:90-689(+)
MAKILELTLEERMDWKFTYDEIDPMLVSCICCTCGVRKPSEEEGGWLSVNQMQQCFCLKAAANAAIDLENLHKTLLRLDLAYQCVDLEYTGEDTPGQCSPTFLCCDGSSGARVCFCVNCGASGACGKVDGNIEQACNCFCLSYVCMLPMGTEPHNNPMTCGLCTKYFVGEPEPNAKAASPSGGSTSKKGAEAYDDPPSV